MMTVIEGCQWFEEVVEDCGEPNEVRYYVPDFDHCFIARWGSEWVLFHEDGLLIDGYMM